MGLNGCQAKGAGRGRCAVLGGLPQRHVALAGPAWGHGWVRREPQPVVRTESAACTSSTLRIWPWRVPRCPDYMRKEHPRTTGSAGPRLPTPCTLGPSSCRPLLTPQRSSHSLSPPTDYRGWYYYNPWLNLNPPPSSCFCGEEEGTDALPWHLLSLGVVLGSDGQKALGVHVRGPALVPPSPGKVPGASCSPQREVSPGFGAVSGWAPGAGGKRS